MQNDASVLKAKAEEITKGVVSDVDKIKMVFYWVQNNIRYIAFENGIMGFDIAREVVWRVQANV